MNVTQKRWANVPPGTPPEGEPPEPGAYWMGGRWIIPLPRMGDGNHAYVVNVKYGESRHLRGFVLADTAVAARELIAAQAPAATSITVRTVSGSDDYADVSEPSGEDSVAPAASGDVGAQRTSTIHNPREREAYEWLRAYAGGWSLLHDFKARIWGEVHGDPTRVGAKIRRALSPRQLEVVLNAKDRDAERADKLAAQRAWEDKVAAGDVSALDFRKLPPGSYRCAAPGETGKLAFVRIDRPGPKDRYGNPSRWHGWTFVKGQAGDEWIPLGKQAPDTLYRGTWESVLQAVMADFDGALARYGHEIGECGICGRALTDEESRRRGIGPKCAARLGAI